jgi:hypothetical protein
VSSRATRIASEQVTDELEEIKLENQRMSNRLANVEDTLERVQQQLGVVTGINLERNERVE